MSNSKMYNPQLAHSNETMSFGAHRNSDRPASAIRSGASSMPSAWQTRATPTHPSALHSDLNVRSFDEVISAALMWCVATKTGKILTGLAVAFAMFALFA